MPPPQDPADHSAISPAAVAAAAVLALVGLTALGAGLNLRFHIENTNEAIAEETRGGYWLLAAAVALLAAAAMVRHAHVPWWPAVLVATPVAVGVVPALLLPGNILPFGSALIGGLAVIVGLIAAAVYAAGHRR